jgi:cell division septation protein DedD
MTQQEYREIQLSKKEVLFLFISLVVLAVVIFVLGVAVGRGVRDSVGEPPVMAASEGETTSVPVEAPPQAVQELSYHDLLAGSGAPPASDPQSAPPTATPTPAAEPPVPQPEAPAPRAGEWFLQVGAFSTRQAADSMVGNLKKLSVPAFVLDPTQGSPDKLFRVRVGPYGTESEANDVRARLVRQGYPAEVRR